jgi:hypothetical protein
MCACLRLSADRLLLLLPAVLLLLLTCCCLASASALRVLYLPAIITTLQYNRKA